MKLEEELTLLNDEPVEQILVTAKDVTEGLDLSTVAPGIAAVYSNNPASSRFRMMTNESISRSMLVVAPSLIAIPALILSGGRRCNPLCRTNKPTTNSVTLYLETNDETEVLLQNGELTCTYATRIALTFTPENWNERQAFNILPADDLLRDGDISAAIFSRTNSSDPFYQETDDYSVDKVASIPVINADNEVTDVQIELQQSVVNEAENGFLNFSLTAEPSENVVISLTP